MLCWTRLFLELLKRIPPPAIIVLKDTFSIIAKCSIKGVNILEYFYNSEGMLIRLFMTELEAFPACENVIHDWEYILFYIILC